MEDIENLEDFERTRGKLRLPADIKPCIIKLIDDPSAKEADNSFIIACELHRIGRTEKQINFLLTKVGIKTSKIQGIIKSIATGRYKGFACPRLEKEGICLYKSREECFHYQAIPRESQRSYRERDFWRFGWPEKLTAPEIVIYLAIREVEKRKGLPAGSRLYVSRKELARVSGVSHSWILECCERLKKKGLIKFKKGTQHRWYGKASEVKRIIPIPRSK